MRKVGLILSLVALFLIGCGEQQPYSKISGEVVGKDTANGRFGTNYYIKVSYPLSKNNEYAIDNVYVEEEEYSKYNIKDKVTIYVNNNGIEEIVK